MCWVLRQGTNCKGTLGPQWTNEATHGFQGSLLTEGALVEVCKGKLSFNYVFQAKEISKQGMEATCSERECSAVKCE